MSSGIRRDNRIKTAIPGKLGGRAHATFPLPAADGSVRLLRSVVPEPQARSGLARGSG